MSIRNDIVAEARKWIGTPYHTHAGVLGAGVDCGMLLLKVYTELGLIPKDTNLPDYAPDWYLHSEGSGWVIEFLDKFTYDIENPQIGDILLFKYGRAYSHACIITEMSPITVVHAYAPGRRVIEERLALNTDLVMRLSSAKKRAIVGV